MSVRIQPMVSFDDVLDRITAEPFHPFRVRTTDGRSFAIRDPETTRVGKARLTISACLCDDIRDAEGWTLEIQLKDIDSLELINSPMANASKGGAAMSKSHPSCPKCGCAMERGSLRLFNAQIADEFRSGAIRVAFVVPGMKTSPNPLKAFAQGLREEPDDRSYDLSETAGYRCEKCGYLELYAAAPEPHPLDD